MEVMERAVAYVAKWGSKTDCEEINFMLGLLLLGDKMKSEKTPTVFVVLWG